MLLTVYKTRNRSQKGVDTVIQSDIVIPKGILLLIPCKMTEGAHSRLPVMLVVAVVCGAHARVQDLCRIDFAEYIRSVGAGSGVLD